MLRTWGPSFGPYDPWMLQVWPLFNGGPDGRGGREADWSVNCTMPALQPMRFENTLDSLIEVLTRLREKA